MELPSKPGHINNLEFIRILTPYVYTKQIVKDKSVLDIGCGFGHGTWLLAANGAKQVVTIDLDKTKTLQIQEFCSNLKNFNTLLMDAQRLGFKDHSFQVITCFEVIEHIPKPDVVLSNIRRLLKTDGVLLLTTPNRAMRLLPFQPPWNKEHLREYTLRSLRKTLKNHFPSFELLGIYGEPRLHKYYKDIWKQKPIHFYFGFVILMIRKLMPTRVKRWITNQLDGGKQKGSPFASTDLLRKMPSVTDPEKWPFHLGDLDEDCLNFFVICSFDDHVVQRSISEIKRAP
jgi:ubiquinone/menaquinone biosynthesis C-methylase UbiE